MDLNGAKIVSFKEIRNSISSENKKAEHVQIPLYQRPYKWGGDPGDGSEEGKRIRDLISDYFSHVSDLVERTQKKDYFAGSIVSVFGDKGDNGSLKQELVDGQQRFTTLYLINFLGYLYCIKYFLDRYYKITKVENFSSIDEAVSDALKSEIKKNLKKMIVHLEELVCITPEFNRSLKALEHDILDSFDSGRRIPDEKFDILQVSNIVENGQGELILNYDRSSYNQDLIEVLSHYQLNLFLNDNNGTGAKYVPMDDFEDAGLKGNYISALKVITEEINERVDKDKMGIQLKQAG